MAEMGSGWSFDRADPMLAAMVWSRLSEPGDVLAARLVTGLGAVAALAWFLSGSPRPSLTPEHPLAAVSAQQWAAGRARWEPRRDGIDPRRDLAQLRRLGAVVLHPQDPDWPVELNDLEDARPHCLYVRGEVGVVQRAGSDGIALVGARACTGYGEHVAGELSAALAGEGRVVVSGGAYGIDAVAHRVALAVGGTTLAVMAGGLDRFYPAGNSDLLGRIAREGAVVSELGPGSSPSRIRFLTRNRLIAALSRACVVVEAGWRSGTLSTANHALTLMRPVAAVPGPVTSAASAGCHDLVRDQKAVLVTGADQVRELVAPLGEVVLERPEQERDSDAGAAPGSSDRVLWDALPARGWATPDSLVRTSGLAPADVLRSLGAMEMRGLIEAAGGRYRRASNQDGG